MLYNALWLKLLGYDNLLPNQTALMAQTEGWYMRNKLQEYTLHSTPNMHIFYIITYK